jgi:hypothetical protein
MAQVVEHLHAQDPELKTLVPPKKKKITMGPKLPWTRTVSNIFLATFKRVSISPGSQQPGYH